MHIMQKRRDFLAGLAAAGARAASAARGHRSPRTGRRRRRRSSWPSRGDLLRPAGCRRGALARRRLHGRPICASGRGVQHAADDGEGRRGFRRQLQRNRRLHLDAGLPIIAVSGLHVGCYELFAREPIRSVSDLKGRRVGIQTLASSGHLYLSIMATHVELDPKEDIEWVVPPSGNAMELFVQGQTDACHCRPGDVRRDLRRQRLLNIHDGREPCCDPASGSPAQAIGRAELCWNQPQRGRARWRSASASSAPA